MLVLAMQFSRSKVSDTRMPARAELVPAAPRQQIETVEGSFPQSRREDSRPNREPHREANLHLRPIALSDTDRASLQLGSRLHVV
jgi:hypothetical protein